MARGLAGRVLIKETTRSLQLASYSFGAALMEILVPLIAGGCVCVLSDEERTNAVPRAMEDRRVNWALFTPSFSRLRTLALGPEAVNTEHLRPWVDHVSLFAIYGSVEQSVVSFSSRPMRLSSNSKEIGSPLPGNRA
ncbi:Nonribosomal peptide synthetase 8-like protein 2 [Colletotrichum chlorophyti]|uniref:Nonribosomal peptide synthetase 8-like protein 2 n=1 Tax=Colletotrichum chlorophyti TaxID=708187 RepID=A0A1Q8S7R4_9PEZI|nr:Nonribosomal peptide synthetase 8-like protein 2 [Colletotrichum chlorophyti]